MCDDLRRSAGSLARVRPRLNRPGDAVCDPSWSLSDPAGDRLVARVDLDDLGADRHSDPVSREAADGASEWSRERRCSDLSEDLAQELTRSPMWKVVRNTPLTGA